MRPYYNRRVGKDGTAPRLSLPEVANQLHAAYEFLKSQGFLQRSFGYECVDDGRVSGIHGNDMLSRFYLDTGLRIDGFVRGVLDNADEAHVFTLVEFLYDHTAKPEERSGRFHSYANCGWHFDCRRDRFDVDVARDEWRNTVNQFLTYYGDGFELSSEGEVVRLAPDGFEDLVGAGLPDASGDANVGKVEMAVRNFRLGRSSREDRKQAVRLLADVLEFYRPQVKEHLSRQDEGALFEIANKFAIRHHEASQRDDYDDDWLTWVFYTYLATVRLVTERVHGPTPRAGSRGRPAAATPTDEDDSFR